MSVNIFNDRFYSFRQPAWHHLGTVLEEPTTASEAFQRNPYTVVAEPLVTTASGIEVPNRAIVRPPVPDDPIHRVFGIVGTEYELIPPGELCKIWDERVSAPVETLGALGHGETFFITTRIGNTRVEGTSDEIEEYLLVSAPLYGNAQLTLRVTPIRVVCQNTLILASRKSTVSVGIRHVSGATENYAEALHRLWAEATGEIDEIHELFGILAKKQLSSEEVSTVLETVYPDPRRPKLDGFPEQIEKRLENFEYNRRYQQRLRDLALELFEGAGLGLSDEFLGTKGTAWGLYNAVVELEDYRGVVKNPESSRHQSRAADALFGYRASTKERAWSSLVQTARQ